MYLTLSFAITCLMQRLVSVNVACVKAMDLSNFYTTIVLILSCNIEKSISVSCGLYNYCTGLLLHSYKAYFLNRPFLEICI